MPSKNFFYVVKNLSLKKIFVAFCLIYLMLIPLGIINEKDKKLNYPEIQILIILAVISSGILEELKNLTVGKDGLKLELLKQKEEIKEEIKEETDESLKKLEKTIINLLEKIDKQDVLASEAVDMYLS